tara:strand:- start:1637 stop:2548 length:912 start_codon:yes stop_codon:yes gene_type:complete
MIYQTIKLVFVTLFYLSIHTTLDVKKTSYSELKKPFSAFDTSVFFENGLQKEFEIVELQKTKKKKEASLISIDTYSFSLITALLILLFVSFFMYNLGKRSKRQATHLHTKKTASYKKKLLENITNEISTPITIINGYLDLIKNSSLQPTKIIAYSNKIIACSFNMSAPLENFLTLSKLDEASLKTKKSAKDMNLFINSILLSFEPYLLFKKQQLFYKSNIKPNVPIDFKYDKLKIIVFNLIANAVKHTNAEKSIHVSVTIDAENFEFAIKDEGIGIAKEKLDTLFYRYPHVQKNLTELLVLAF